MSEHVNKFGSALSNIKALDARISQSVISIKKRPINHLYER